MSQPIVSQDSAICLVGGGLLESDAILGVKPHVSGFIGVDGGADHLLEAGIRPLAVIGDLDSLSDQTRATFADLLVPVAEQSTTDFEKALTRVAAPAVLALGFTGGRLDHTLAVLNVMARMPERAVVLLDASDASVMLPKGRTRLVLPAGARLSLMPMDPAQVTASGLVWPFADQAMLPAGFISPSNAVADGGEVVIETDTPVLLILARALWPSALQAVSRAG